MTRSIEFRPEVQDDIASACRWYNDRDETLGKQFLEEFQATLERILWNPHTYSVTYRDSRSARLHRFPYVVHYRVAADKVKVFAVMHGSRDPTAWQERVELE